MQIFSNALRVLSNGQIFPRKETYIAFMGLHCHSDSNIFTLRKLAHAIYRKYFGSKNENYHWKVFDIFLIFAQNIDCGYTLEPPRRGGSNEYPQSMFWSENKKNRYTLHTPVFSI